MSDELKPNETSTGATLEVPVKLPPETAEVPVHASTSLAVPVELPPETVDIALMADGTPRQPVDPKSIPRPMGPKNMKGPPAPGPRRGGGPRGGMPQSRMPQPQNEPPRKQFLGLSKEWGANLPNKRMLDASLESELDALLKDESIAAALSETQREPQAPKMTDGRKKGKIIAIHGRDVFVDVPGGRGQGVLPLEQFTDKKPVIGEEVEFAIERVDGANGVLVLTMEGATQVVTNWNVVQLGMIVEAKVTGLNKNKSGLLVEVNGLRGFMPMSQVDLGRVEQPEAYENQRIKCMVVELNPEERNLILSRRALIEKERAAKAEEFWANIAEGQVRKGVVKSIKPFGAFVDLGGADGLIPASEFSWQRVNNLEEVVKPGQDVEVMVQRLDLEHRKIGLSLKALQNNPFNDFANQHRPGTRLSGKVTRLAEFGAFVELAPGIEGLVHVSELSTQRVRRVYDIVAEGDEVSVQILSVDPQSRRVSLTMKAIEAEAASAADAASAAEAEADRKEAADRMANRKPSSGNLRGGMGGGAIKFG
jgi:small subunit ribosomal protein S1